MTIFDYFPKIQKKNSVIQTTLGNTVGQINVITYIQGDFFNWASPENVPRLAPLKNALTGPPYFGKVLSMAAGRGEIPNTLTFSIPRGGQSRTLTFL